MGKKLKYLINIKSVICTKTSTHILKKILCTYTTVYDACPFVGYGFASLNAINLITKSNNNA